MWSFVQGGMTPMQALRCGTLYGARYLGLDGDLGSIEAGKLADLIVLRRGADPMKRIRDSEKIDYVVVKGEVFQADRMNRLGENAPRRDFFWAAGGVAGMRASDAFTDGCSCGLGR